MRYSLSDHLAVEDLGHELLICDASRSVVHRVTGPGVAVVRAALAAPAPITVADDDVLAGLVAAGVLVPAGEAHPAAHPTAGAHDSGLSRRRLIGAGAAAAGTVGLVTMALPGAAAAASGGEPGPDPLPEAPENNIFTSQSTAGVVQVYWESDPEAFTYSYNVSLVSGSLSGEPVTGTVNSTTGFQFTDIYTNQPSSQISITFVSNTTPPVSFTQSFTRA